MCNPLVDKIEFCANVLNDLYKTIQRRNELTDILYNNDIDISNMEIELLDTTIDCLSFIMGFDVKDDIEWWLFENVDKKIYVGSETWDVTTEENLFKCIDFIHNNNINDNEVHEVHEPKNKFK